MSYLFSVLLVFWCLFFPSLLVHADSHPVINEFLPHPSSGNKEWVELYVPDGDDISHYWIDDDTDFSSDAGSSSKKEITSPVVGSDSKHVVFELSSSMFNNSGDTIALFAPDGTLVDQYQYTDDPGVDVPIGRSPDSTGGFQILTYATRGSANSSAKPPDTPTPAPTDKPTRSASSGQTKETKPTETPKPIKIASADTTQHSKLTTNLEDSDTVENPDSISPSATSGAEPTSILGVATKAAQKKVSTSISRPFLVKSATSVAPTIAVTIGGLLLVGCGILLYLKKTGKLPFKF